MKIEVKCPWTECKHNCYGYCCCSRGVELDIKEVNEEAIPEEEDCNCLSCKNFEWR